MTRGFVLGKFMPPHAGHVLLCATAAALVDELTILVCALPDDPIPGPLRRDWMAALFPHCRIVYHDAVVPQEPADHPDFWRIWRNIVRTAHPGPIDRVFASEAYGARLAAEVGAAFVPVDPGRIAAPVSASAIRADPIAHWAMIPEIVRPYFTRRICLHGPESVGKSTLAAQLVAHFGTVMVPEYGRTYCETFGTDLGNDDLLTIARAQAAMAKAMAPRGNGWLILDTDPLMTAVWSDMMLGARDPWFDAFGDVADLYLLLDTDLPWVDDGTRIYGSTDARARFFGLCQKELETRGVRWTLVSGHGDARLSAAFAAIRNAFPSGGGGPAVAGEPGGPV
jgi:HTH-type transcriptional regulator, transcriptional repressor of NAD biosynthesis genes